MASGRKARTREVYVTPRDIELLSAVEATGSIVDACARIAMTRDTAMYRLRRLAAALGAPVVASARGGASHGGTALTSSGRRILLQGAGPLRGMAPRGSGRPLPLNVCQGAWRSAPQPHVDLGPGLALFVTFTAREGESVRVAVEPEAIVVARSRFPSSARNVVPGTIEAVRSVDALQAVLRVRVGEATWLDAAVTPRSETSLRLRPGARVYLYLKATAVARIR